ncbi:MAG: glycine zipper 2TM domain-containing protein, partial [Candidatus Dadabacteria bacterium]|nr:glycine zipper 2TM domain-containing protein [Candidatus Dadabacteria bacterium]NIQ13514.1 glycine zipper 2TM domain-containing protein [Candidatus Dadabacteria bacterium]
MGSKFKKYLLFSPLIMFVLISASSCSRHGQTGAAIGGTLGALTGVLIDDENNWRGAAIGGAIGATLGGALGEISSQASKEAVRE